jgi:NAD(P)-dependent dehydrogenase (short-subunit alcohol dehydrogenase family)
MVSKPTVFISSITSDIGLHCARRYASDGWDVYGTFRSTKLLDRLDFVPRERLWFADLNNIASINESSLSFGRSGARWTTFMSCAAQPGPLTSFFGTDFQDWSQSIHVNAIEQLRALHSLHPFRAEGEIHAVFFAGPATNNAVRNFSALALSKIMLIKMCELLDAENPDLNAFIVGPGWTRTKTHQDILNDPAVSEEKRADTLRFLESNAGTSLDDIYDSIVWLCGEGRTAAGGRNFSVVHDCWGSSDLARELRQAPDMYKLRRSGNGWRER